MALDFINLIFEAHLVSPAQEAVLFQYSVHSLLGLLPVA